MDATAAERPTVLASSAVATRTTAYPRPVYGPEGGGGEGDEEPGPMADCGGNVLAPDQARANELESVPCVESGAGCTDCRASVAAADAEPFSGFVAGVEMPDDLADCAIQGGG